MPAPVPFQKWPGHIHRPFPAADRPFGDIMHEIAMRSPKDIRALRIVAREILARLDHEDLLHPK